MKRHQTYRPPLPQNPPKDSAPSFVPWRLRDSAAHRVRCGMTVARAEAKGEYGQQEAQWAYVVRCVPPIFSSPVVATHTSFRLTPIRPRPRRTAPLWRNLRQPPRRDWSYTFSAKEKDSETGLSYFGSRYYSSDLSIWLSVDPMASKYPSLSPYVYCANNPVRVVDPDGEEIVITETTDKNGNKVVNISFTAILVNKTSTDISDGDMAKYKNDIITGLEKTYNGKKDDGTIVNIDVDITIQPNDELVTPFTTRHTINIVDKLEDMDHSAESLIGGGTMDIRLDVCKGYYPDKPSGRSAAHEFGHLLGLKHNQEADNIMNPNGRGRVITGAQIQEASKNYQKGIINNFLGITVRDDHRRQSRKAHK